MCNPFRRQKKELRDLRRLSMAFALVSTLNRQGVVHWQVKEKILLIEESLAVVQMAQGEKGFKNLLNILVEWQNFNLISEDYERLRIDTETKAVREAQKKYPDIDKNDIRRIRQEARAKMKEIKPEKLNTIHEFDIFIIRASAPSANHATEENGQLLAIGHYDGEKVEMAMYEDIKQNLRNEE